MTPEEKREELLNIINTMADLRRRMVRLDNAYFMELRAVKTPSPRIATKYRRIGLWIRAAIGESDEVLSFLKFTSVITKPSTRKIKSA